MNEAITLKDDRVLSKQSVSAHQYISMHVPAVSAWHLYKAGASLKKAKTLVLRLDRHRKSTRHPDFGGGFIQSVEFPFAWIFLTDLLLAPDISAVEDGETLEILLPRKVFDAETNDRSIEHTWNIHLYAGIAKNDPVLGNLAGCLQQVLSETSQATCNVIDKLTSALGIHIAERYGITQPAFRASVGGLSAWQLHRATTILECHIGEPISLKEVAQECSLSTAHFSRAFTRSTGVSPHRWLILRRIAQVKNMIRAGNMPLAEIALACGFSDQSHLTKVFSNETGQSPIRWKRSDIRI